MSAEWWKIIDPNFQREVLFMDFHNLMVAKGCCSKLFDTRRLVQHAIGEAINPDGNFLFS
jgi:hypothetical protein